MTFFCDVLITVAVVGAVTLIVGGGSWLVSRWLASRRAKGRL